LRVESGLGLWYYLYMMTMEQTVTVAPDHKVLLNLPPEFPVGRAKLELVLTPLDSSIKSKSQGKIRLTKSMIDDFLQDDELCFLTGILHTDMSDEEVRSERLMKYDRIA